MSTVDISGIDDISELTPTPKNIIGNMILVVPNESNILKKIKRIESKYRDQIVSKNQNFVDLNLVIFVIFEGNIQDFQRLVVEINSIEELKNFRYLIIN